MRYQGQCVSAVVVALLMACGGGGSSTSVNQGVPGPRLYVADDNAGGKIRGYDLPISSTSTPAISFASPNGVSVALDANGNLAAIDNTGTISIFHAPLSNSSTAAVTFVNGTGGEEQLAFSNDGRLFACTQGASVNIFTPPFSNASVTSGQVTDATITGTYGIAFDNANELYLVGAAHLDVLPNAGAAAPSVQINAASGTGFRQIAFGSTVLCAADVSGSVQVYTLPILPGDAPTATIISGMSTPESVAVDANGNLYVANEGDSTIKVYAPPFSDASAPVTTLTISGASIFGIAFAE